MHARGRDLIEIEKAMMFNKEACTWVMLGDASDARVSAERQAVLAALQEIAAPASVADVTTTTQLKPTNVRRMLQRMAREGTVVARSAAAIP